MIMQYYIIAALVDYIHFNYLNVVNNFTTECVTF